MTRIFVEQPGYTGSVKNMKNTNMTGPALTAQTIQVAEFPGHLVSSDNKIFVIVAVGCIEQLC